MSKLKITTKTFFWDATPLVFKVSEIVEVAWQISIENQTPYGTERVKRWCEGKVTEVNAGIYTVEHCDKDTEGNTLVHEVKILY